MKIPGIRRYAWGPLALIGGAALLVGCGGGGGGSDTTPFSTTVIDGALHKAVVFLDKNDNGALDDGEPNGVTNDAGKVTFNVANADLGRYPVVALIGLDAIDADSGPVKIPYSLSAPPDKGAVVSPLTTLVLHVMVTTGVNSVEAAKVVTDATGLAGSVFQDYTQIPAPTDGTVNPAILARMLVVTTQQQFKAVSGAIGTAAADGRPITKANLDLAIRRKLLERMPNMLTALAVPAIRQAAVAALQQALIDAADVLVTDSGLTLTSLPTVVAINSQISNPQAPTAYVPTAGAALADLNFTDALNYYLREWTWTIAMDTPDANNQVRSVERRRKVDAGFLASWGSGSRGNPARQADLHWNGNAWVACPLNFESTSTVRDAQGVSRYNYCGNRETGTSQRASFDIAGQTMASVLDSARAAGFTNITVPSAALAPIGGASAPAGSGVFPADAQMRYQSNTILSSAITYSPAGKDSPPGVSNVVNKFTSAFTAGGVGAEQPQGTGCNANEGDGTNVATLGELISSKTGNPCIFTGGSFVYQAVTYTNPDTRNESWGAQTVSMGTVGTAPVNSGPAPGFYTTNTRIRVAFKGTGTNPTTYYACKERFNTGSSRNCDVIGTGSYTISTLGDARVMTFNNVPAQRAALDYDQVFVERGGAVYYGYRTKLAISQRARPNVVASAALLAQLGIEPANPSVPLALSAGSYQGIWDFRGLGDSFSEPVGTTVSIFGNGSASCQERDTLVTYACTVTISDPATGAFSVVDSGGSATGTLNFMSGSGSGTFIDLTSIDEPTGSFVSFRR